MERKEEREEGEEGRSRRWPVSAKDFGAAKWLRFRSPRQPSDHLVVLALSVHLPGDLLRFRPTDPHKYAGRQWFSDANDSLFTFVNLN